MIVRVDQNPDQPATSLPASIQRDSRLTPAARGLLVYLLILPTRSGVRIADLVKQWPGDTETVYAVLESLETAGYFKRIPTLQLNGTIGYEPLVYAWNVGQDDDDDDEEKNP